MSPPRRACRTQTGRLRLGVRRRRAAAPPVPAAQAGGWTAQSTGRPRALGSEARRGAQRMPAAGTSPPRRACRAQTGRLRLGVRRPMARLPRAHRPRPRPAAERKSAPRRAASPHPVEPASAGLPDPDGPFTARRAAASPDARRHAPWPSKPGHIRPLRAKALPRSIEALNPMSTTSYVKTSYPPGRWPACLVERQPVECGRRRQGGGRAWHAPLPWPVAA